LSAHVDPTGSQHNSSIEQLSVEGSTSSHPQASSSLKTTAAKKAKSGSKTTKSINRTSITTTGSKGSTASMTATAAATAATAAAATAAATRTTTTETSSLEISVGGRKSCGATSSRKVHLFSANFFFYV
jgi:hypothetical protein